MWRLRWAPTSFPAPGSSSANRISPSGTRSFYLFSIVSILFRQNVQVKYRIARSYNDTASKKYACSRNLCCFLIGLTSTGITRYQSPKKSRIASIICCYTYIPRRKSNLRPLLIYLYTYCIYFFNRGFQSAEDCRKKQESYCPGNNYYIT